MKIEDVALKLWLESLTCSVPWARPSFSSDSEKKTCSSCHPVYFSSVLTWWSLWLWKSKKHTDRVAWSPAEEQEGLTAIHTSLMTVSKSPQSRTLGSRLSILVQAAVVGIQEYLGFAQLVAIHPQNFINFFLCGNMIVKRENYFRKYDFYKQAF